MPNTLRVDDLDLVQAIYAQGHNDGVGKGYMTHQIVTGATRQQSGPAGFRRAVYGGFEQIEVGVTAIAANQQAAMIGAITLMIDVVFVAGAAGLDECRWGQQIVSRHIAHFAGDVISGADEQQLLRLAKA